MANDVGIKLKIEGEKEYKQSLKNIIASQKEWESEIKAVDSALESEMDAEEKSRRKGELLEKQIESQEKKLGLMKEQLEKVEAAYGKDSREAAQMRTNINNATTALNRMRGESQKLTPKLKTIGDTMQKAGKKMQAVGDKLNKYVAAPLGALAATSVAAFKEVDAGLDIVTKKTGATGQALIDLQESARNVATTIPTSFETAGSAIGEVNTKFGLVGEDLEDLSMKFVKFADLNDMDVSNAVDKTQKVMQAFGVESKDAGKMLDAMNKVGQNTGISMDTLSSTMVKNAASLRDMGMDAYDAAQFLGQVEMSGATTADVMTGMKKAMTEAAEDGMTLPEKLKQFDGVMHSSASETEKLQEAIDTFGKKAGPAIYKAYEEGTLNLGLLSGSMDEFVGSVDQTYDDIKGDNDQMELSLNKVKDAVSRIGETLLGIAAEPVSKVADGIQSIGDKFNSLDSDSQAAIGNVVLALIAAGPVAKVGGSLLSAVGKVTTAITGSEGLMAAIGSIGSKAAGAAIGAAPFALLAAGLGISAKAIYDAGQDLESQDERILEIVGTQKENLGALKESVQAIHDTVDGANAEVQAINDQSEMALSLVDELEKLESQTSRTVQEEARMQTLVDELNTLYPDLKLGIDKSTGALTKSTGEIKKYIQQAKKIALLDAYTRGASAALDKLVQANNDLYVAQKGRQRMADDLRRIDDAMADIARRNSDDNPFNDFTDNNRMLDLKANADALRASIAETDVTIEEATAAVEAATAETQSWNEQIDAVGSEIDDEGEAVSNNTSELNENTEAQKSNKDAYMERAQKIGQSAQAAIKAMQEEQAKWDELYNSARDSIEGQVKLFDEWSQDSELTFEKILGNMDSQVTGMQNYSSNMEKLAKAAADSGDENFKAFVKYISDMGIEGAQIAQEMVKEMETEGGNFQEALAKFAELSGLKDQTAETWAYIENDFKTGAEAASEAFNSTFAYDELAGIKQMKENAVTAFNNIIPALFGKGKESGTAVGEGMGDGIEEWWEEDYDSDPILARVPQVGEEVANTVADSLEDNKGKVTEAAESITGEVSGISGEVDKAGTEIKSASGRAIMGMIGGMLLNQFMLKTTSKSTGQILGEVGKEAEKQAGPIKLAGDGAVSSLADGMDDARKDELEPEVEEVGTVVKSTVVTVGQMMEDFKSSGRQVIRGLTIGMDQEAVNAYAKATAIAGMIKTIINNALKIHSPSRVMMETGRYISEGLALGMEQQLPEVERASAMLSRAVVPFGATNSDVIQLRAEAFGGFDVDQIYAAVRSGAADGQQPVIISEKSFKRALVGMGVQVA